MKTRSIKGKEVKEEWYLIDAKGVRLGRLATKAAVLLMGKEKVVFNTNLNPKVKVIIINSKEVDIHPKKVQKKIYYHHSGYIGGLKTKVYNILHEERPNKIIEIAIKGMLPKNKQRSKIFNNLFIYENDQRVKHEAQKPVEVKIN